MTGTYAGQYVMQMMSFELPLALVPLLKFTSSKEKMGSQAKLASESSGDLDCWSLAYGNQYLLSPRQLHRLRLPRETKTVIKNMHRSTWLHGDTGLFGRYQIPGVPQI
ncbi:hypothetical protein Droror1_Dr00021263 [Drosera rotundifolia]